MMARFADRINNKKNKWNNSASIPALAGTVGAVTGAVKPSGASAVPDAALISAISGAAYPKITPTVPNAAIVSAITGTSPFLKNNVSANTPQSGGVAGGSGSYQMESYIPSIDIGERPSFNSQYMEKLNELAKQLTGMNFGDWTQGEQYRSLADRYSDSGRMGMQDVLGQIAARTGGLASSYASTAAQQQYNSYMSQLEQVARQMYDQDRSDILSDATLYRNLVNDEYGRYRDELADYNERLAAAQKAALEAARLAARGSGSGGGGGANSTIDTGKYYTKPSTNRVSVPNYGQVSFEDAETLEKKGLIKLLGVNKKGEPVFAPTTKKNYRDPVKLTR